MIKLRVSPRMALVASVLVLALSGCQGSGGGAGSADPHHYTAEEARAAFQQHMQSAGPGPRLPTAAPGNVSKPQAGH